MPLDPQARAMARSWPRTRGCVDRSRGSTACTTTRPRHAGHLEGVERLAIIARNGVGLDFVDVPACSERGIAVTIARRVTHSTASAAGTLVLAAADRLGIATSR